MPRRTLPFAVVLTLLGLAYMRMSEAFPFYYAFDMDWVTTLDALIIQSGELPDHVFHPSFGMYLLLSWSHRLASAVGHVSLLDLSDVAGAGNPLLGAAELTDYFRRHTPVVLVAIVLAQVVGLSGIARLATRRDTAHSVVVRSLPFALLVLLLVGVQESAFYHATLIQSEAYSLLFWCLAVASGVGALRAQSRRTSLLRFVLVGAFLTLTWATKVQSTLLVGWLLLLLFLLRELGWSRSPVVALEPARGPARLLPGLGMFASAAFLVISAARFDVPQVLLTGVEWYRPNSAAVLVMATYAVPVFLAVGHLRLPALEAILTGALVAFTLHLLIYSDPRTGWSYMLVDVKMLLFRQSLVQLTPLQILERIADQVAAAPGLFVVHACLLALSLRGLRSWRLRAVVLLVEVGLLAHVGVATRDFMRDMIWTRLPLTLWTIVLSFSLLARPRVEKPLLVSAVLLLVLALVAQTRQVFLLPSRLATHAVDYRWRAERWLKSVYSGTQRSYTAILDAKVDPLDPARWLQTAATQARDWAGAKQSLGHVLVNQRGSLRDVTTAEAGFVLPHDSGRIAAVSSELRGGLIVRPRVWAPTGPLLDADSVRAIRVNPEAQAVASAPPAAAPRLALLGRPDLAVVLFLPAGAPTPPGWSAGPEQVDVETANGPASFRAFRFDLYGEVEVSRLGGGAFVLVKRRF